MNKNLSIAAFLGFLTVVLGAFGAHALKERLGIDSLNTFETGVRYQMYHVFVLLFVNSYNGFSSKIKTKISWIFYIGILLFSGSIYVITIGGVPAKSIWFITPLGGLFLLLGWLSILYYSLKSN